MRRNNSKTLKLDMVNLIFFFFQIALNEVTYKSNSSSYSCCLTWVSLRKVLEETGQFYIKVSLFFFLNQKGPITEKKKV